MNIPCVNYFGNIPENIKCGDYWQCGFCHYLKNKEIADEVI